ncbi:MAG: acyl-ACP--UDP-N-acetylglucosamine O-acyltransferase [bacterium]
MSDIHETAVIEDGATLGDNVKIGAYTVVSSDSTLADGVELGPRVSLEGDVTIGEDTTVASGAILGSPPQDRAYDGEPTKVRIGKRNIIREYVTVNRATSGHGEATEIGDDNMIMSYCHVAHNCKIGDNVDMANGVTLAGHVEVEDHVMMGGLAPVHQFVRIGEYAMVGGLSRINKDIVPYIRASGNPAKVFDVNVVGLRRSDMDSDTLSLLKKAVEILFRSGNNTSQAVDQIKDELPDNDRIQHLLEFIDRSERGILKK